MLGLALPSPPQVVQPPLPTRTLFEQELSNKLHNSLVINNKLQTKQCIKQTRNALPSPSPATVVTAMNKNAALPLATSQSSMPALPTPNSDSSTVFSGSKKKKPILDEFVSKFGSGYQESIITKKKGKNDHNELLPSLASSRQCMKPSTNKYYQVKELTIYNVITIVIREYAAFSKNKLLSIRLLNTDFAEMIPKLQRWLQIDFSLLRKPQLNYESQTQINPHQVCTANAAMAHFGLDPGRFLQWIGGEYTGQHRDAHSTLAAI